jgi:hypothetical protein
MFQLPFRHNAQVHANKLCKINPSYTSHTPVKEPASLVIIIIRLCTLTIREDHVVLARVFLTDAHSRFPGVVHRLQCRVIKG